MSINKPSRAQKRRLPGYGRSVLLNAGFSNQTALILIATCYPLGIIAMSLLTQAVVPLMNGTASVGGPSLFSSSLSESEARSVIESWWNARSRVFAPPYDPQAANEYVSSGPLWDELTKTPDGPVSWLKAHDHFYTYQSTQIERVISLENSSSDRPSLVVSVKSSDVLQGPGVYKPSSGTSTFRYTFAKEGGKWKIWDYDKV